MALGGILALFVVACGGDADEPTPTPVPEDTPTPEVIRETVVATPTPAAAAEVPEPESGPDTAVMVAPNRVGLTMTMVTLGLQTARGASLRGSSSHVVPSAKTSYAPFLLRPGKSQTIFPASPSV